MNRSLALFSLIGLMVCAAPSAYAADTDPVNCLKLNVYNCRKDFSMDPKEVHECILRGYDVPLTCRKDEGKSAGVRTEGSSGFSYGTIQSPQASPGAMAAGSTVSMATIGKSFGYPPWPGSPCTLSGGINLCAPGGPTPNKTPVDTVCPQKNDNSGLFGVKRTLTTAAMASPCGTAIPLTNYELTLNRNPDRMVSTEQGSYYIWLYNKTNATTFSPVTNPKPPIIRTPGFPPYMRNPDKTAFALPTYLCNGKNGSKAVDLTAPIAQIITYKNGSTPYLLIRLVGRENLNPIADPALIPPYDPDAPEKYLVIPIVNGNPKVPVNCDDANTYWKTLDNLKAEIVLTAGTDGGCTVPQEQCQGLSTTEIPPQNCEFVTLDLSGSCDKKTQYVILDRANLVYPPPTTATMLSITGQSTKLAPSVDNSYIFTQASETILLGNTAPVVTLDEGGMLALKDGSSLRMEPPVTLNPATGQITLTGGGKLLDSGGSLIQDYASGTTYTPTNPVIPWTVNIDRSMKIPSGYLIPTQSTAPYAQDPAVDN